MMTLAFLPQPYSSAQEWVQEALSIHGLDASLYASSPKDWLDVWVTLSCRPVAAQRSMLDYQLAYMQSAGHSVWDISLILRSDGRPVGLFPLCLQQAGALWKINSMGSVVGAPLFVSGVSQRTIKRICKSLLIVLQKLACDLGQRELLLEQPVWPLSDGLAACSEWHQQLMASGASIDTRHDLYADLRPDLAAIRATFRKSYRPLINVGLKTWETVVVESDSAAANIDIWHDFKKLHKDVSGRSTRSDMTWDLQWSMIKSREAFLVALRDPANLRLVGAGFFQFTSDEGLYAVGAYDRSLFDKPLGHVVQQRAIETLKALGIDWYRVGERHYRQSLYAPSDKEVAISEFKQGFSSHLACRHQFVLKVR